MKAIQKVKNKIKSKGGQLKNIQENGKWTNNLYTFTCSKGHQHTLSHKEMMKRTNPCPTCSPDSQYFRTTKLPKMLEEKFLKLNGVYKSNKPIPVKCLKCDHEFTICSSSLSQSRSKRKTLCYNCEGKVLSPTIIKESINQHWNIISGNVNVFGYVGFRAPLTIECKSCKYTWDTECRHAVNDMCPNCAANPDVEKNIKGIIYKIVCKPSEKVYIGQTIQKFAKRVRDHFRASEDPNHPDYYGKIGRAIRKYNPNDFEWTVLRRDVPWSQLDSLEIQEIKNHNSYHNGLNSTEGGNIGNKNAIIATKRFEKHLKAEKEKEIKDRAAEQQRGLNNFEKGLRTELTKFTKKIKDKELELQSLIEHRNRTLGGNKRSNIASSFIGVCWDSGNKKWRAAIKHKGKKIYLGLFEDEIAAALAYNKKAIQLRGPNTKLNHTPSTKKGNNMQSRNSLP